jgi:hypothetical protein
VFEEERKRNRVTSNFVSKGREGKICFVPDQLNLIGLQAAMGLRIYLRLSSKVNINTIKWQSKSKHYKCCQIIKITHPQYLKNDLENQEKTFREFSLVGWGEVSSEPRIPTREK